MKKICPFLRVLVLLCGVYALLPHNGAAQNCHFTYQPTDAGCQLSPIRFIPEEQRGFAYFWDFGDGNTSRLSSPVHVYAQTSAIATYTISLTLTDTLGQTTTCSQNITVRSPATPIHATGNALGCDRLPEPTFNFETTFTITQGGGGDLIWDWGDGSPAVTTNALTQTHTYTRHGIFYLTIRRANENCPAFVRRIRFYGKPAAEVGSSIGGSDHILCEGEEICIWNASDISTEPITYFVWKWKIDDDAVGGTVLTDTAFDDGPRCNTFSFTGDQFAGVELPEFYEGRLELTAYNECYDSLGVSGRPYRHEATTQIDIYTQPRANFGGNLVVCASNPVVCFNNNTIPPNGDYTWDFNDPNSGDNNSNNATPCHTFTQAGTYNVHLVVQNGCGIDSATQPVTVLPQPVALAQASDTDGCMPMRVEFTNLSTPAHTAEHPVIYNWTISPETGWVIADSGNHITFKDPVILFVDSGRYEVTLHVVSECDSVTWSDSIIVGRPPTITMEEIADTCRRVCLLPTAEYNDFGLPITAYLWEFGSGTPGTSSSPQPTDSICFGTGTHTISLQATNECGSGNASTSFTVADLDSVSAGPALSLCINQGPVRLGGFPAGGRWTGEDIDESGIFSPQRLGDFELIYTFGRGVCQVADTTTITVLGAPEVEVLTPDTALCEGSPAFPLRTAQSGGNWDCPLLPGNLFSPDSAGIYICRYTISDGGTRCSATDSLIITVNPLPDICVRDTSFCLVDENIALPPCPHTNGSGHWEGPGITDAGRGLFNPRQAGTGMHRITYCFTTTAACTACDTLSVTVTDPSTIYAGEDTTLCINEESLILTGFAPAGGRWDVPGQFLAADSFEVRLSDIMAAGGQLTYTLGSGSCEVSDQRLVSILDTLETFAGADLTLCEGSEVVELSGQASPSGGIWKGPGVDTLSGRLDPALLQAGSTYEIFYCLPNPNGCTSRNSRQVTIDELPQADFVLPADSCVGASIPLLSIEQNGLNCHWDFGNGESATQCSSSVTYTQRGRYRVSLQVENANGCADSLSKQITIYDSPVASFSKNVQGPQCANEQGQVTVEFTDLSDAAGGSYFWDFGNGQSSTLPQPPPIEFAQDTCPITYYITLTITNECNVAVMTDSLTVLPRPQVNWGTQVNQGCSPLLIEFNNITLGKPRNFSWFIGDSLFSADSIPRPRYFHTDSLPRIYQLTLKAENACGTDSLTREILVKPNTMNAFFNTDPIEGCTPLNVQFTDFSGAPNVSWRFFDPRQQEVATSNLRHPAFTFEEPGVHWVEMYADNGCSYDTGRVAIKVFPNKPARFSTEAEVCAKDSLFFAPLQTAGITSFIWRFGDGDSSHDIRPLHFYQQPGTYSVSLTTIADSMGCANSWDTLVRVRALPPLSFELSDTSGCMPHTIAASGVPPNYHYSWSFGDSSPGGQPNTSNLQHPTHTYDSVGQYLISLQIRDDFGCRSDSSAEVFVHPLPQPAFLLPKDTICLGESVEFVNRSRGTTGCLWQFGDGDSSRLKSPSHRYTQPGRFMVSLQAQNAYGCEAVVTDTLWVLPASQARFAADPARGCFPLHVNLSQASTHFSRAYWDFGDGTVSTLTHPGTHLYDGVDTLYTLTLIVDTAGHCADTAMRRIEVGSWPLSQFDVQAEYLCNKDSVYFLNHSHSMRGNLSYQWYQNGQLFSHQQIPAPFELEAGIYTFELMVENDLGCRHSSQKQIQIYPQPSADLELSAQRGCSPLEISFKNRSTQFSQQLWLFGDGQSSREMHPTHVYTTEDDTLEVSLIVDTAGICFDTASQRIFIATPPVSQFESSEKTGCSELRVHFQNQSTSAKLPLSYTWDFAGADPPFSDREHPEAVFAAEGSPRQYVVRLSVRNSFGCEDMATDTIRVYPQPLAMFEPVYDSDCSPKEVQFLNHSENYTHSQWLFGDGASSTQNNPMYVYEEPGDYSVGLLVHYEGHCRDSISLQEVIHVEQSPVADFTYTDSVAPSGQHKGYVQFHNRSLFADRYRWDFGDNSSTSQVHPTHQYALNGEYSVQLIAFKANGCTDTLLRLLAPANFGNLYLPNAFAPNAGSNELFTVFKPIGIGLESFEIAVYNKWGTRVWHSLNELDELGRPTGQWDGQGAAVIANREVFVWKVLDARFAGGREWQGPREGTVTLIR